MAKKRISKKINKLVSGYVIRLSEEDNIPIQKVIVYGSQVKGTKRKWSDIDVCIISPKFTKPLDALQLLWRKRNREEVLSGLEPIGFTPKDFKEGGSLIEEIKRTGVELK